MNPKLESVLSRAVEALRAEVGENLHSCCLYGSEVRGNAIEGVSDLNVLVVLNESNSLAHQAVSRALGPFPQVDPFVLGRAGFERSVRAFATKFASIRRHHQVLYGADPLAEFAVDPRTERFLCEQAVRNLRLRLIYSFITRSRHKSYDRFVIRHVTPIFVQFSEALRLEGLSIPTDFAARIPIWEQAFKVDGQLLRDLLALKHSPQRFSDAEGVAWHDRLVPLMNAVLRWIEERWTA